MTDINTTTAITSPRRAQRPERIDLGDDQAVRNDVIAKEQGVSERTLNRGDAIGAPYVMLGGVKYRPIRAYRQFLTAQIQVRDQPKRKKVA